MFTPQPPPDFDNVGQLKELVEYYRENDYEYQPSCIYHAQRFSWYAGQAGWNVSWFSISKTEYNRLFDKITLLPDERVDRHYICGCLVDGTEYWIDPQTAEIVRTKYWAVGK
jgi:hypothetical protein